MLRNLTLPMSLFLTVVNCMSCDGASSKVKNVFGEDDRTWVTSRDMPLSVIGKLDTGCTGTLIGRKLMLTGAHCVFDSLTQRPRDNFTRFSVSLRNGQAVTDLAPVRAWIGSAQPEEVRSTDWAIVELSEPIGDQQGFMDIRLVDFTKNLPLTVSLAGYSSDINAGLTASAHKDCSVHAVSQGRLFHDCDSTTGVSGGPLYASIDGKMSLVGITVSEFRNNKKSPVQVDQWSTEFTNVGIPSEKFAHAVNILKMTTDKDMQAPIIPATVLIDFKTAALIEEMSPQVSQHVSPQVAPQTSPNVSPQVAAPQVPAPQVAAPQTNPQIHQQAVYNLEQLKSPNSLWSSVNQIQDVNVVLIDNASQLARQAVAGGNSEFTYLVTQLNNATTQNLSFWNSFVEYGVAGNLAHFDTNLLYDSYLNIKTIEKTIISQMYQMPDFMQQSIQNDVNVLTDHVAHFESLLFVR